MLKKSKKTETVGGDMPLFLIYLFLRFIVKYEDMGIGHCLEQTYYIVWLVDVDWMHFEVGLKWACWLYAEI
jgi:hypothetical protein